MKSNLNEVNKFVKGVITEEEKENGNKSRPSYNNYFDFIM